MPKIKANGIEIEYDCFGNNEAEAVLLISGLGTQKSSALKAEVQHGA
jgi:hypothetical protein